MRNKLLLTVAVVTSLLFTLSSCEDLDELADLGLRPHILAPALKTEIDIYDFEKLLTQNTEYAVSVSNIPSAPTTVALPFPGYGPSSELPPEYLNIFEIANEIVLEELVATISFNNIFPVDILPNTTIILKDSVSGTPILTHVLDEAVAPGETYSIPLKKSDITISSTLALSMDKLTLASSNGEPVQFSNDDFILNLAVELIDLDYVELKNDISYSDIAIHPFDLNIPDAADTSAYSGSLSIFLTNKYPANFDLRMDLLDENENLIYQVFGDSSFFVQHAPLNDDGTVILEKATEASKIDFINVADINNLNNVKKMRVEVVLKTPSAPTKLILSEITTIDMLVTADIKVDPSKSEE